MSFPKETTLAYFIAIPNSDGKNPGFKKAYNARIFFDLKEAFKIRDNLEKISEFKVFKLRLEVLLETFPVDDPAWVDRLTPC